jgi:hypothetical protein
MDAGVVSDFRPQAFRSRKSPIVPASRGVPRPGTVLGKDRDGATPISALEGAPWCGTKWHGGRLSLPIRVSGEAV